MGLRPRFALSPTSMRFAPLALVLGLALAASGASAQTEGVGLRLTPSATYIDFSDDSGLDNGFLYGGGVGFSFGEFVELGGTYLFGRNFETDYTLFSGLEEDPVLAGQIADLPVQEVDIQRYGGDLRVNLGSGTVFPFLRAGTGLVRFQPDNREEASRNIYLLGGVGLQLSGADRYAFSVSAENFAYRYNPATTFFSPGDLAGVGLSADNFNQTTVQNLALRASLSLYLAGRRAGTLSELDREFQRQFSGGLSGLSLVVEPFYGRVNFDEAFPYRDQTFVGGEAGFDLGSLVGFRGFYGRGVPKDDPTDFQDIQMYGGDVRLRLSEGRGFVPFVTVGGGYLDVLDEYATEEAAEPGNQNAEDRPFALAGGGVEILLSPRLRAVGEVRGLVMSTEDADDLSQPDNVFISPFFRGGLSFGLGGDAGSDASQVRQRQIDRELAAQRAEFEAREAELRAEIAEARADGDEVAARQLEAERDRNQAMSRTAAAQQRSAREPVLLGEGEVRTAQGDRIVTIPLPEQGELYVRYGDPGGVSIETTADGGTVQQPARTVTQGMSDAQIRSAIRDAIQQSMSQGGNARDMADLERRLNDRLRDQIDDLEDDIDDIDDDNNDSDIDDERLILILQQIEDRILSEIRALRTEISARPVVDADGQVVSGGVSPVSPVTNDDIDYGDLDAVDDNSFSLSPVVGLQFGDASGAVVGLQGNYRTGGSLFYIPEILVGVAGDDSFAANADVAFNIGDGVSLFGSPYVRTGLGFVNVSGDENEDTFDDEDDDGGTSLTFNLGIGADIRAGGGRFFADFTSGNFGSYNRLTAGYRFGFGN